VAPAARPSDDGVVEPDARCIGAAGRVAPDGPASGEGGAAVILHAGPGDPDAADDTLPSDGRLFNSGAGLDAGAAGGDGRGCAFADNVSAMIARRSVLGVVDKGVFHAKPDPIGEELAVGVNGSVDVCLCADALGTSSSISKMSSDTGAL